VLDYYKITDSIFQSRNYSVDLLNELVTKKNNGEDVCALENKYIVFINWIEILEQYLLENFSEGQRIAEPAVDCLTDDEITELMAKMKIMRGNNRYQDTGWVIDYLGNWTDLGRWDDSNTWQDNVPIV